MRPDARATARFVGADPVQEAGRVGVLLTFSPVVARLGVERIDDWAELDPERDIPAVGGLGKILRLLRAARIAAPTDPATLVGDARAAVRLLERAIGTKVKLQLRRRSQLRFHVWTEEGRECVDQVSEVREYADAYMVVRRGARLPLRFDRSEVVRQRTECETWFEVVDIERP